MTRINVGVKPKELYDQHLITEIKEINQLVGQYLKSLNSKNGITNIPDTFTLNTGHVRFFYNKFKYLHNRFNLLSKEAINRGYDIKAVFPIDKILQQHYNDYIERVQDRCIIMQRIHIRVLSKPEYYRYYGEKGIKIYECSDYR